MIRFFLPTLLLALGCGRFNFTDTRGDYLARQMGEYGCGTSSPCNFLVDGGPEVYSCTENYPDSSTLENEFGPYRSYRETVYGSDTGRPRYTIYSDGTGEPDADVNYNDLFPPLAHPDMIALQQRGEELGCRTVHVKAFEDPNATWNDWRFIEALRYSCVISTCEAWVDDHGEIVVRKTPNLPDGA